MCLAVGLQRTVRAHMPTRRACVCTHLNKRFGWWLPGNNRRDSHHTLSARLGLGENQLGRLCKKRQSGSPCTSRWDIQCNQCYLRGSQEGVRQGSSQGWTMGGRRRGTRSPGVKERWGESDRQGGKVRRETLWGVTGTAVSYRSIYCGEQSMFVGFRNGPLSKRNERWLS